MHEKHASYCEGDADCSVCHRLYRAAAVRGGTELPFFVVAYGVSRHFGGPEEGGWYYDRMEALAVKRSWGWKQGLANARALREEYPTQKYGRGSVLGNGQDVYISCVSDVAFIRESLERPTYE
jgi:hypothetical protein